ncbi:acetylglutamate kinase [Alkaliphilus peptidifermentans]|uniref:Acetylglutamate kinase n=1 Tax=Alkaliphilus peptidifermentans DSM 18978 TaxID=1120976 RepID=A0A1G5HNS3_9FIRM|nr:acetylglutamate kinase [Alkaliphilus peptidifermentans]SCY65377.1 N-acetylglutamate kinase [Alkaliphilus peptidifermentans DSM 18978]
MEITPQQKAHVLVESLAYIKRFHNQIVVIKYGGHAMINNTLKKAVIKDIALMKYVGMNPVVVHGGGPEITEIMKSLGKKPEFIDGLRVTDKETMELTEMVLCGKISSEIVSLLNHNDVKALGISGKDGKTIQAAQKSEKLGLVGEITHINTDLIHTVIKEGYVPVISPVGVGTDAESYNINADEVAGQLAVALGAKKLVLITDVDGVLMDAKKPETLISEIKTTEVSKYINEGIIKDGMIPKVQCCMGAVTKGVERCHIIDGRKYHSILLEIFTDDGIGTMITT